ncbi:EF-hand domain-containing protein D1-like isoform X2 [Salvelinus fontinalis]|uniref:EF-hand domain-containing protein D1-like isoform X2 n=1 Tax=Salvelinus fontinalis TaxID=8038 RepID=UPI0024856504|nr:EF-hand domain-containing protein D1-like isoform X2 [Salvelinus fontinalis]
MASDELARKLQPRMAAEQAPQFNPCAPEETPVKPSDSVPEQQEKAAVVIVNDATSELTAKLTRRLDINNGNAAPKQAKVFNPSTEFKEFSRKQIKDMENIFKRFDSGKDGFIDLMELKLMMEKLGAPQTHLGLKNMIREVDEDFDSKLSYRENIHHEEEPEPEGPLLPWQQIRRTHVGVDSTCCGCQLCGTLFCDIITLT